jgi:hypothetical protein
MGIDRVTLDFIEDAILDFNLSSDLKMVELGNQYIKGMRLPTGKAAKTYFEHQGFFHVSIDINQQDGAINVDLNKEIKNKKLLKKFDILTNCGTSEHIKNQYICWKNIHNLVKKDGLFIHLVPLFEHWKHHGHYKFTVEFFNDLAFKCNYDILNCFIRESGEEKRDLIYCSMIKIEDNEFIFEEDFLKPIRDK